MNISQKDKLSMIKQLYELSTDTQVIPFLDEATTSRIRRLLETVNFSKQQVNNLTPVKFVNRPSSVSKKKYNTEMQQIHEINQQYEKKFAHLFSDDEDDSNILKQIDVQLNSNNFVSQSSLKYNNFIVGSNNHQYDQNHSKSSHPNNNNSKPIKQSLSKTINKKQNINSLTSTHSNLFHIKPTDDLVMLKRKPSKEKLISYKVKTQHKENYDICTPSPNKLLKKKENTPSKYVLNTNHSRSTLQSTTKSPINCNNNNIIKRSQSQSTKFIITTNPGSLNSTSKQQKLPLLRTSQSKSSLSTSKLKPSSKKSISVLETTTGTKRQLNSLPSVDVVDSHLRLKIIKRENSNGSTVLVKIRQQKKSKSKQKYLQANMKKAVKRTHTQCSVEKLHLKEDFLQEMRTDEELNFDLGTYNVKKQQKQQKSQQNHQKRRAVTQMFPQTNQDEQEYFYESQQMHHFEESQKHEKQQGQLTQEQPLAYYDDKNIMVPDIQKIQESPNKQNINGGSSGYQYLKQIMNEISVQREQKMRQKVMYERQIAELKEKVIQQKKALQNTLMKNSKLQNQLQTTNSFHKSTTNQRSLIFRCITQTKKKTTALKQSITKNTSLQQKLINQELKQEQQLIQMYQNVIDQLKAQIKQQFRKKVQAKTQLELYNKKKDNKSTKFNSTLLSSQRIKHNLTDAFREWV